MITHSAKKDKAKKAGGWKKIENKGGKQCKWGLFKLGKFWKLWELYMSGKASLTCWRAKCSETAGLKNYYWLIHTVYVLFFLDLIQVTRTSVSCDYCFLLVSLLDSPGI